MNFELTEERQMLQDTLRRYLSDKYTTATRNEAHTQTLAKTSPKKSGT